MNDSHPVCSKFRIGNHRVSFSFRRENSFFGILQSSQGLFEEPSQSGKYVVVNRLSAVCLKEEQDMLRCWARHDSRVNVGVNVAKR